MDLTPVPEDKRLIQVMRESNGRVSGVYRMQNPVAPVSPRYGSVLEKWSEINQAKNDIRRGFVVLRNTTYGRNSVATGVALLQGTQPRYASDTARVSSWQYPRWRRSNDHKLSASRFVAI